MFGHYRLGPPLGGGGGGEVWRAYDTRLERTVALKTMRPELLAVPDAAERFRREARLAARLDHPNIVRVHSTGEIDGRLYIDMQLVDGSSVADLLDADRALDPAEVLRIVRSVAAALDRAHGVDDHSGQRMIHRDVKPGNILVAHRPPGGGHVYLADFGVARPVKPDAGLTVSGAVVGTPAYLAPELWKGRPPDHRIDVYALAVTTFEMLVGERPFTGRDMGAYGLMNEHLTAPVPSARAERPELPAAVDDVIARGMAKSPDERWPTAGTLADELADALLPPLRTVPAPVRAGHPPTLAVTRQRPAPEDTTLTGARAVPDPGPRGATPPPDPGPPPPRPGLLTHLGTWPHVIGLGTAALAVPLYGLGVVPAGWRLVVSTLLLYVLGLVVTLVARAVRR